MKTLVIALALAAAPLGTPALACDAHCDEHGMTFIALAEGGTTRIVGCVDDLGPLLKRFKVHASPLMGVNIDGKVYTFDDPDVIDRAREIFTRDEPFTSKQKALEREMEALQRRQDALDDDEEADAAAHAKLEDEERALDRRQEELDEAQDRVSDQMMRDLEALAREAIAAGKARSTTR